MAGIFNYSLIRAVPDERRGEWVNIGVVVYRAERLEVRLIKDLKKLRALNEAMDVSFIYGVGDFWNSLCTGIDDDAARQAMLERLPGVHASPMGQFISDDAGVDSHIESIMRDLVDVPLPQRERRVVQSKIEKIVQQALTSKRLMSPDRDITKHLVVAKFPIDPQARLYADFAIRNGALRITETIDFRVSAQTAKTDKHRHAALKAISLDRAKSVFSSGCIPLVVFATDERTPDIADGSIRMLGNYAERMFDISDGAQFASYLKEIEDAAFGQGSLH